MAGKKNKPGGGGANGYHDIDADAVISVDEVTRQAEAMAEGVSLEKVAKLANNAPFVSIEHLNAGYGKMEILHDFNMQVARKQSLCLIGPNGAGKSTILHSIFGFTNIFSGKILIGDGDYKKDITSLTSSEKLKNSGIAYILQDKSVFPGMTVEENLWMGGYLMDKPEKAKEAAEKIFSKYSRLAERRTHQAKVLSGGERRLLEITRALVMEPEVLLVDEPSIGLEPRIIDKGEEDVCEEEGCLSIPEVKGKVNRPDSLLAEYQDLSGELYREELFEPDSRVFQHELDHLNGVLFLRHLNTTEKLLAKKILRELEKEHAEREASAGKGSGGRPRNS